MFWNTTYRASDYASPLGEFGIPLNHPSFIEWVGVPESAGLLEIGPRRWLNTLSCDQARYVAIQLHRDVCMMATNLDVLDQYALSLQGTASKMMTVDLGSSDFPSADVAAGGAQSPPRFRPDGGYGSVATLIGSYHPKVGLLGLCDRTFHGQCFLDVSVDLLCMLHCLQ